MQQISASQFDGTGLGHEFKLRVPLSKVGASRCAECGEDVYAHARTEVSDTDALTVLNAQDDRVASAIEWVVPGKVALKVGGFKAALAECERDPSCVVVNCAGHGLHAFLPNTAAPFDALRAASRVLDLEWEDRDDFVLEIEPLLRAIHWARQHLAQQNTVVVNCAQGKSRSGAMATAFLMAAHDLGVDEALRRVREHRPLVQPNKGFLARLREVEGAIRQSGKS